MGGGRKEREIVSPIFGLHWDPPPPDAPVTLAFERCTAEHGATFGNVPAHVPSLIGEPDRPGWMPIIFLALATTTHAKAWQSNQYNRQLAREAARAAKASAHAASELRRLLHLAVNPGHAVALTLSREVLFDVATVINKLAELPAALAPYAKQPKRGRGAPPVEWPRLLVRGLHDDPAFRERLCASCAAIVVTAYCGPNLQGLAYSSADVNRWLGADRFPNATPKSIRHRNE